MNLITVRTNFFKHTEGITTVSEKETPVASSEFTYILPYPGILPHHPLYFLKNLRDKIVELMITNPISKSDFYVLQADKSLSAAMFLLDQEQEDIAVETIIHAEQFLTRAVDELARAKESGKVIPSETFEHITQALLKHQEVLQGILTGRETLTSSSFPSLLEAIADNRTRVDNLK